MNWKAFGSKVLHGLVPAIGAAAVAIVAGGPLTGALAIVALKAAGGAFIAYMVKPARPAAALALLAFLALGASACSHTFDACMRDKIESHAAVRIEAAAACNEDTVCLTGVGEQAAAALVQDAIECKAATKDGGGQ